MLTPEQEKWIDHLSDTDQIKIVLFDVTAEEKFQAVKARMQTVLGSDMTVEHRGATSLGISGQDEIDVYIPVSPTGFDSTVTILKALFGEPRSYYPAKRARFVTEEAGKHIDIFPINQESSDWKNLVQFETYLSEHPEKLDEYRELKESGNRLSVREYYRRKTLFINEVLGL